MSFRELPVEFITKKALQFTQHKNLSHRKESFFYRFSISFTIGIGLMPYGVKFVTIVFEYKIILILKEM